MDPRFTQHAERFRVYTSQGVTFARRSRSPIESLILGVVGLLIFLLFLLLLLPLLVLVLAAGVLGAAWLGVRRLLRIARSPNGHIGPVRTDGRSNVRVIDRNTP